MINSLAELNDAVNGITNYITQTVSSQTKDGSFTLSLEDIDYSRLPYHLSEEDLYAYGDFIASELAGRKEFESVDFNDHEFSGQCKREYCPQLEDRQPDEPLLPVSQPLSMTQLSEIGESAISALQSASLSSLRDILNMDFLQIRQLGLSSQQHYFTVESPDLDKPYWSEDIDSILRYMNKQCEKGSRPTLYYNLINDKNDILQIPLAEECCGKISSIPTEAEHPLTDTAYTEAVQKVEGAVYNLPWGYGLSYIIKTPDSLNFTPLPLRDAIDQFTKAAKNTQPLALTACLNAPDGKQFPEAVILFHAHDRTIMNARTDPDSPFQPRRGSFYSDLVRLTFPDRILDIDRWRIKVIAPGETHGRSNHLVHEGPNALVEFRDMEGASSNSPEGILVSSYSIDDLIGEHGIGGIQPGQGLNLYDNVESWTLSASEMTPILTWLRLKEAELGKEKAATLNQMIQDAKTRSIEQGTALSPQQHKQQEH